MDNSFIPSPHPTQPRVPTKTDWPDIWPVHLHTHAQIQSVIIIIDCCGAQTSPTRCSVGYHAIIFSRWAHIHNEHDGLCWPHGLAVDGWVGTIIEHTRTRRSVLAIDYKSCVCVHPGRTQFETKNEPSSV